MREVHPSLRNPPATLPLEGRVNFQSVFEGLFNQAFKDQLTPALREELGALGLDLGRLQPAYPHAVFLAAVAAGARAWFPGEPPEQAWFKIGARNLEGFYETFLGRPLFALLRLLGPRRTVARMKANFRSANNYSESRLVELSPTELQLWMNEPGEVRFFIQGVMHRGVQLAGAPNLKLDILHTDDLGTVYGITL